MLNLIFKRLIENRDLAPGESRRKYGVICGAYGICWNVILFLAKLFAGLISGSISVIADAVNNLSDATSSLVTLFGFRMAGKSADIDHPFGHGRYEYISGMIVAMLIVVMGFELFTSSVKKIFAPDVIQPGVLVFVILLLSVAVKLYMWYYNRRIGRKINSPALLATATDSLTDCISTLVVLICQLLFAWKGINLDAWCGLLVAAFILYAGVTSGKEIIDHLLGKAPDPDLVRDIHDIVMSHENVLGIHDLIIHDYGPGNAIISLHAEVPSDGDILELHDMIDNIEQELKSKTECLAVIHMDPIVVNDYVAEVRGLVEKKIKELHPDAMIHDFRMVPGPTHSNLLFDAVIPYEIKDSEIEIQNKIRKLVAELDHSFFAICKIDRPFVK